METRHTISLADIVLSWSMADIFKNKLYKRQVKKIPDTFSSSQEYLDSFIDPLVEDTRAALSSSLKKISESFCCEIKSICKSKNSDLEYRVLLEQHVGRKRDENYDSDDDEDEHVIGDLIAITNVKPRKHGDLNRSGWPYLVAVITDTNQFGLYLSIKFSRPIILREHNERDTLYAVKVMNLTTNTRIWSALNANPEPGHFRIIENVLRRPFVDTEDCDLCRLKESSKPFVSSAELNESQNEAVSKCIDGKECRHENSVKLIWGPPGTGKTKTVGFLLRSLVDARCRTLTCAPTNIATLEVTKRVVEQFSGYGLGDIVLLGNKKRMKIKRRPELHRVFLDFRVKILHKCFSPVSGWTDSLASMISLLKNPEEPYRLYLSSVKPKEEEIKNLRDGISIGQKKERKQVVTKQEDIGKNAEKIKTSRGSKGERGEFSRKNEWNKVITKSLKGNESNKEELPPMTFEEFVRSNFNTIAYRLYFCIDNLYIHLPSSRIPLEVMEQMFTASAFLKQLEQLLRCVSDQDLKKAFGEASLTTKGHGFDDIIFVREKSIKLLSSLPQNFLRRSRSNKFMEDHWTDIREFCLKEAFLIFCTVSSSATLYRAGTENPFEMLVIDEAAQLKECESAIPLQLPQIRHAILIGDEKQLPAMVHSETSEKADFGRSLYERLALLGHKKLLLNVQHRMNPSISAFPNREFYDNMILDGPNVKLKSYQKSFLEGDMFGSYSFINVPHGKEKLNKKYSTKNMAEVAVVADIISSLYKEYLRTKKKFRLGVISPYKAQVHAMNDKFGKQYSSDHESDFSVSIRSVDGFQGGEEDIIIISTVRCNMGRSVGFLSNLQRTNVALTRARYCLWIVGCGTTLGNSDSVWRKVVIDAKERKCFHNAEDDQSLSQAIIAHLLDFKQIDALVSFGSRLFKTTIWKVSFAEGFWRSMGRYRDDLLHKKVFSLLEKLSIGWRLEEGDKRRKGLVHVGKSSSLVEYYEVSEQKFLVWAVDFIIDRASDNYTQVLKVWDFLKAKDAPKLADQLDILYGGYSLDKMNRCSQKLVERDLIVPMRWPVNSAANSLSKPLASLSLRDKPETSLMNNTRN